MGVASLSSRGSFSDREESSSGLGFVESMQALMGGAMGVASLSSHFPISWLGEQTSFPPNRMHLLVAVFTLTREMEASTWSHVVKKYL